MGEAPIEAGKTPRPQRPAPGSSASPCGWWPGVQREGAPFSSGQDPTDPITHTLMGPADPNAVRLRAPASL